MNGLIYRRGDLATTRLSNTRASINWDSRGNFTTIRECRHKTDQTVYVILKLTELFSTLKARKTRIELVR
jgi:hypothetical protein